jgi:hypothetical protein
MLKFIHTNSVQFFRNYFAAGRKTNIPVRRLDISGVAHFIPPTTLSVQLTAHSITQQLTLPTQSPSPDQLHNFTPHPSCTIPQFHSDTHSCFSPLTEASSLIDRLISGDGQHLIPILDPLFVSEYKDNDGKMDFVGSNVLIRGLKDFDLQSVR